jgi:bacteriocin biosynthesis cyclodehydratase domain-containing protein
MIHKPRFRSHLRVEGLDGPLWERLLPRIDGRNTTEEIADALQAELSPLDVAFGLSWLEEQGWIVEAGGEGPLTGFADALGLDLRGLQERSVTLIPRGEVSAEPLEKALRTMGVRIGGEGLAVVLADDYLRADLADFDRRDPWMLLKPVGTVLWIGPLFEAGRRGCRHCLAERLRGWRATAAPPQPAAPSTLWTAAGLAATEVLKWVLQGGNPALENTLVTFDVRTLETARHAVVPVPGCPVCGGEARKEAAPLRLSSRSKVFTPGGGDRAATPEAMLRRYGHLVSPLTGIVDRLVPSLETQDFLQIYTAGYLEPAGPGRNGPRGAERLRSAGRGLTAVQARAAALCEALERHSGFFQGTESRIEASRRDLGEAAIHPNDCLLISERQYAGREVWNALDLPYHWLPEPFDEDRPVEWTPAWSLTRGDFRWLPTAYAFYDYPLAGGHRFCRADSNGCAAGSCLEEAVLQGFLEIVERDALALWWYNRARRPGVLLDGFRNPWVAALAGELERLGRRVWVLDLTTDLGIPAFVAISREISPRPQDLILGAGAHLDPALAISKALTEITQFLPGFLAGRPRRVLSEDLSEDPGETPYLTPDPDRPPLGAGDLPSLALPDLREEVELCVERARGRGLEVLVVDQTREDVGLPVVRVVVPGMRLFRARFAPGRLYGVPVALGWLPAPLREGELNPVHILI